MPTRALPFGQITPVARPIGAFVQPGQPQPAAPARPFPLPAPTGIRTLPIQGGSSVAGANNYQQLANALSPFSRSVVQIAEDSLLAYQKGQIEQGYYEVKNQQVKANLSVQAQSELGAASTARQIGQLEKGDREAAQLLEGANPFRLVGRRRALAQMAGAEIGNVLEDDLALNATELSTIPPDSPALLRRQVGLSSQVLDKYQLTGDEPEVHFYVIPELNKAWDNYRADQRKLYNEALEISTRDLVTAALTAEVFNLLENGYEDEEGKVLPGAPEFTDKAARYLTLKLDQHLAPLSPKAKERTIKFLREQLFQTVGDLALIRNIRVGPAEAKYESRPTLAGAAPYEVIRLAVTGQETKQQRYDLGQQQIERRLDLEWDAGPGSLPYGHPDYQDAVGAIEESARAQGLQNPRLYITTKSNESKGFRDILAQPDPFAVDNFIARMGEVSPGAWTNSPEAFSEALKQAQAIARTYPEGEQQQQYARMLGAVNAAREDAEAPVDPDIEKGASDAVAGDLDTEEIRRIRGIQRREGQAGQSEDSRKLRALAQIPGIGIVDAMSQLDPQLTRIARRLYNLYIRNAYDAVDEWKASHPGQVLGRAALNRLISASNVEVRKSEEWAQIYREFTGRNPGEVGDGGPPKPPSESKPEAAATPPATPPVEPGASEAPTGGALNGGLGVSMEDAARLPDETVRGHRERAIMSAEWFQEELLRIGDGRPVSGALYEMAKRAGTSTTRFLLDQLHFYPSFDQTGTVRQYLEQRVVEERADNTVSENQAGGAVGGMGMIMPGWAQRMAAGFDPFAPGSWLMRVLQPPRPVPPPVMPSSGGTELSVQEYGMPVPSNIGPINLASPGPEAVDQILPLLLAAIAGNESGGASDPYRVLNQSLGTQDPARRAVGKYQVMPDNIGPWSRKHLGYTLTREQYRNSPEAQEKIVSGQMRENLLAQLEAGYSFDLAIRRAAALWYGGYYGLNNIDSTRAEEGGPPVVDYTFDILGRVKRLAGL